MGGGVCVGGVDRWSGPSPGGNVGGRAQIEGGVSGGFFGVRNALRFSSFGSDPELGFTPLTMDAIFGPWKPHDLKYEYLD